MMRRWYIWASLAFIVFAISAPAADKQPGCAVMTFEAKNGVSKEESAVLADGLESELIQLKRYRMVSRANLGKVLEAQKVSMECAGTECAIEAGRIAAIEFVVFGSIGKVGETYSLVANLANVETGVIEQTAKITQSGKIDQLLISGVGEAANKLLGLEAADTASPVSLESLPSRTPPKLGDTLSVDLGGGETLDLVWIEPGSFMMGSPADEPGRDDDETQHRVTLTKGFWMGKYEVTQGQWERVMGTNPSKFKGARNPVEQVSWEDCQAFIRKLNALDGGRASPRAGLFRLPAEAEWEYACRAGTTGAYAGNLDDMGWYENNSGATPHPVGLKNPNAWGLYDMHGNVWEWCQDWHGEYSKESVMDPLGGATGWFRVYRGGSWSEPASVCRSAFRFKLRPGRGFSDRGVRVVR